MATNAKDAYYMPEFVGVDGEGGAVTCLECACLVFAAVGSTDYCITCDHVHVTEARMCEVAECGCGKLITADDICEDCEHSHITSVRYCESDGCDCKTPRWASEVCECGHNRSSNPQTWPSGHRHEYLLLRAGDDYLYTGKPLSTWECLAWLADLPKGIVVSGEGERANYSREFVSYFFDYDSTMMLRDIPAAKAWRILFGRQRYCLECTRNCYRYVDGDTEGTCVCGHASGRHNRTRTGNHGQTLPVDLYAPDGSHYEVDYLPGKEFKVKRAETSRWTVISDMGTFYQCAFLKSLKDWDIGTKAQRRLVALGKRSRGSFTDMTETEIEYNRIECVLLSTLADEFRDACRGASEALAATGETVNLVPKQWQGPGRMAVKMLQTAGNTKSQDLNLPLDMLPTANAAYYGGRFEAPSIGQIDGPVYEYDRNSAYPYAMLTLPCLLPDHGEWRQHSKRPAAAPKSVWVGPVHFVGREGDHVYGLPVRDAKMGTVYFPREANGIYWSTEIEAAERLGTTVTVTGPVWEYRQFCDCQPFKWIPEVYKLRFSLGKKLVMVIKLGLNSLYGKQAQSIGEPPYANPVYAGLITAHMRAGLLDCAAQIENQTDILMFATDAVFTTKPMTLPGHDRKPGEVKKLGDWDAGDSPFDAMFTIQPGMYLLAGELPKTRGIPRARFTEYRQDFYDAWSVVETEADMPNIELPTNTFRGARFALHLNRWETAGQWFEATSQYGFNWLSKRAPGGILEHGAQGGMRVITDARQGGPDVMSEPYGKAIGHWSEHEGRMMYEAQPWGMGAEEAVI